MIKTKNILDEHSAVKIFTISISIIMLLTYVAAGASMPASQNSANESQTGLSESISSVIQASSVSNSSAGYNISYGRYLGTLVISNDSYFRGYLNATNGIGPAYVAYSSQLNEIFFSERGSNSLAAMNITDNKIIYTLQVGSSPLGLFFNAKNEILYIADSGSNVVSELYAPSGRVVGKINVGNNPQLMAYDSVNETLFVSNWGSNNVTVINTITNTPVANVRVGNNPTGIAYDPNNDYIYVSNYNSNTVTVINAANYSVVGSINVGSNPKGIAVDKSNNHIFVADEGSGQVTVINGGSNSVLLEVSVQNDPYDIVLNSTSSYVYVSNYGSSSISVFNGINNEFITTINLPANSNPKGMLYMQTSGRIYVADYNINEISIVSSSKYIVLKNIHVSFEPTEIAYDPSNDYFYVTDTSNSLVYVISSENYSVIKVISVLSDPSDIIYDPFNGNIYVANFNTYNVTIISGINNTIIGEPYVYGNPYKFALNPSNGNVFVTIQSPFVGYGFLGGTGAEGITIINGSNFKNTNFISIGSIPESLAYDPANNNLYVATVHWNLWWFEGNSYDGLAIVNLTNGSVSSVYFGSNPWGVAYDPANNNIYVTDSSNNNLYVLNTTTNSVVLTIPVGTTPTQVFYNPWNQDIYTLNRGSDTFSVVSGANSTLMDTVTVGLSPHSDAVDISQGYILVTQNNNASIDILSMFSSPHYSLEFREKGISNGIEWSVTLNSYITMYSSSNIISFAVPNGSYEYYPQEYVIFGANERFKTSDVGISIYVSGVGTEINITYVKQYYLEMVSYPANAGKLIPGSGWYDYGTELNISEVSGKYFKFESWTGYGVGSYSGQNANATIVMDAPIIENANYVKLFNATFTALGLSPGAEWYVNVWYANANGINISLSGNSFNNTITFLLPNGSYNFAIISAYGYQASPYWGTFFIENNSVVENVLFEKLYNITFTESGLPTGANWSISLYNYTNEVIYSINLPSYLSGEYGSAYDAYNGYIYVTSIYGYVEIIDPVTENVVGSIYVEGGLYGIVYDSANYNMYVTDVYYNNVAVINTTLNQVVRYVNVGSAPLEELYDASNNYIYVSNYNSNNVTVINGNNNDVVATINTGNGSYGMTLDNQNGYLYVVNSNSNNITVINTANNNVVSSIQTGNTSPQCILYDQFNNYLYVSNYETNNISILDPSNDKFIGSIHLITNAGPEAMIYDTSNNLIYIADSNESSVSILNPSNDEITQTLGVGVGPNSLTLCPTTGTIYVLNSNSNSLSIIIYIQFTNMTEYSTGNTIVFSDVPGYYYYSATGPSKYIANPSEGYFTLNNTSLGINIKFSHLAVKNYTVFFNESGLPSNLKWSVTLNGTTVSTYQNTIYFTLPNGTYDYSVETPIAVGSGTEFTTTSGGVVIVDGSGVEIVVTYTEEFYLNMSVIPTGSGTVSPSSGWYPAGMDITLYPSAYAGYIFINWTGTGDGSYTGAQPTANIVMKGPINETALFAKVYNVKFTESGLRTGTSWGVSIINTAGTVIFQNITTNDFVTFSLPNGTYTFKVKNVSGYTVSPRNGKITVVGEQISISVQFSVIPQYYSITFTESGLATGTSWSVTLNGVSETSSNSTIVFNVPNGTYTYTIGVIAGYRTINYSGAFTVSGNSMVIEVVWSVNLYDIKVSQSGIPNGTSWSVTLTGTTFNGKSVNVTLFSDNSSVTFTEPNGTYFYKVNLPSEYTSSSYSGKVILNGGSGAASVYAKPVGVAISGTSNYMIYTVVAIIVIGAALGGAFAIGRRKR